MTVTESDPVPDKVDKREIRGTWWCDRCRRVWRTVIRRGVVVCQSCKTPIEKHIYTEEASP